MRNKILFNSVSYRFDADRSLGPVSFELERGDRVAILGASGAGKSTMLKLLAGLLRPERGEILISGDLVSGPSARASMMLQRPALLPWLSVRDNVALGFRFQGRKALSDRDNQRQVSALLEKTGLSDRADARPSELSGGQQQRVALARSLATRPEILLLDEPFSALDLATRQALRRDVLSLCRDAGSTLVLVTHDIADALALTTRALVLGGTPSTLRADMGVGEEGIEYLTDILKAS